MGDVFMQIAANNFDVVRSIECDVDMRNYLLKATKNRSLNVLKKKKGANISLDTVLEYDIAGVEEPSDDSFLDYICAKSEYDEILEAIHSLNDKYRNALYYHYVLGYTVPETAKLMMQSVPTTKQQLVRGKKMLVVLLEEKGVCKNGAYKR